MPAGGQPLNGTTSDLSTGGVGARIEDPGPPDTRVAVRLELGDGGDPLECEALVVRRVGAVSALRFEALDQIQERRIQRRVLEALRRRAERAA
jgi:c-di-GMP-binding flagellar brake protein YcgR